MQAGGSKLASGAIWNVAASMVRMVLEMGTGILLARLLLPDDFGVVAMATVVSGFVSMLGAFGFGSALVQREELKEAHRSSSFWAAMGITTVLGAGTAAASSLVAGFYDRPEVTLILVALAAQYPLGGLGAVPNALLQREMRFATAAKIRLVAAGASSGTALVMAYSGCGYWSLVARPILLQTISALGCFLATPWRPKLSYDHSAIRDLLSYSTYYYGSQLFRFLSRNVDSLLIGKLMGAAALGLYSRAYNLMLLPLTAIGVALQKVLFVGLAKVQREKDRSGRMFLRASEMLAIVITPLMFGLCATADVAVPVVLGPQWVGMVPSLRVFCLAGIWQGILSAHDMIYLATGRTDLQFKYTLRGRLLVIVGIVGGLPFDILGVAVGFSVGSLFDTLLSLRAAAPLIGLTWVRVCVGLGGSIACSTLMVGAVVVGRLFLFPGLRPEFELLASIGVGVATYLLALPVFCRSATRDLLARLKRR